MHRECARKIVFFFLVGGVLLAGIGSASVHAQDQKTHGTVQSASGQTVMVELTEGYRVEAGTEGTILVTKTTFGQKTTVEQGKLTVEGVDGRTVTARLTSGEKIKGGQTVSFASVRSVGTLSVTAQPRSASVSVDGSPVGEAPVETTVEAGTRTVTATSAKCPSVSKQVGVERGTTRQVDLRLDCPDGMLVIRPKPDDAAVYLNGKRVGTGTLRTEVPQGRYQVEVRREAYKSQELEVGVGIDETVRKTVALRGKAGTLTIETEPSGAQIFVRQPEEETYRSIGEAPMNGARLASGSYDIIAQKGVYSDNDGVEIGPDVSRKISLQLFPSLENKDIVSPEPREGAYFGHSIAEIGDVDGDGVPDIAVGARNESIQVSNPEYEFYEEAGTVYIVSGNSGTVIEEISSPDPEEEGWFGWSVSGVGDVTGDGVPDLAIGAVGEENGRVYLVNGASRKVEIRIHDLPDARNLGSSVESVGDVTGDEIPDLLIGAPGAGRGAEFAGLAYLVSGDRGKLIETVAPPNPEANGYFGHKIVQSGDMNKDGVEEIVVAANGSESVYVVSGDDGEIIESISPTDGDSGFGGSISKIGDVTGDGVVDFAVGAKNEVVERGWDSKSGRVYVVSGSSGRVVKKLISKKPEDGGRFGQSISYLGDIDGDGVPDFAIGASNETATGTAESSGRVYLVSGAKYEMTSLVTSPNDTEVGALGDSMTGVGDVNGDGIPDLAVGAPGETAGGEENAGRAYIFTSAPPEDLPSSE